MMTLEQVRDELRRPWNQTSAFAWCAQLADAIDAHLSQPQPVAQGEAVAWQFRNVLPGQASAWRDTNQKFAEDPKHDDDPTIEIRRLYAAIPTGHRVVPVEVSNVATNLLNAARADMAEGFDKISVSCSALELVCEHMVGGGKA